MTSGPSDLNGLKVRVVEDNLLLAEVIRDLLEAYGCEVVGPVPDVTQGVAIAREAALDGAVLDINLGGEPCFPIATALAERALPYMFLTGYDNSRIISAEHRTAERILKPVDPAAPSAATAECFRMPSINQP